MNQEDIAELIEYPEVYDGWSVAVMRDGTLVNRWADPEHPERPRHGYERRYEATQKAMEAR